MRSIGRVGMCAASTLAGEFGAWPRTPPTLTAEPVLGPALGRTRGRSSLPMKGREMRPHTASRYSISGRPPMQGPILAPSARK